MSDPTPEERIARHRARREKQASSKSTRESANDSLNPMSNGRLQVVIGGSTILLATAIWALMPGGRQSEGAKSSNQFNDMLAMITCESIIKRNLRDPSSYQLEDRSLISGRAYISYRAKNGFGGYVRESKTCSIVGDQVSLD